MFIHIHTCTKQHKTDQKTGIPSRHITQVSEWVNRLGQRGDVESSTPQFPPCRSSPYLVVTKCQMHDICIRTKLHCAIKQFSNWMTRDSLTLLSKTLKSKLTPHWLIVFQLFIIVHDVFPCHKETRKKKNEITR